MTTYLLTWNPERWHWEDLQECIEAVRTQGYYHDSWSSGVTKKIKPDDRVFLRKLGGKRKGIVASGWATRVAKEGPHWDKAAKATNKTALYIKVDFDTILDPEKDIFPRSRLDDGIYTKMHWEPQASGTTIPDDVAAKLENDWAEFLNCPVPSAPMILADETNLPLAYIEGAVRQVTINAYERSSLGRTKCINHYGSKCSICGFDFEKTYGEIGKGFIHVHHLKSLAEIGKRYKLNPINDLRPVCPNCHAMLHRRKPNPYSIQELKAILKQR